MSDREKRPKPYEIHRVKLNLPHPAVYKDVLKGCFGCPCAAALVTQAIPDIGGIPMGERQRVECDVAKGKNSNGLVKFSLQQQPEECFRRHREEVKTILNPSKDPVIGAELTQKRKEAKRSKVP